MSKFKKFAVAAALAPLGALAEDTTPVQDAVQQLQTAATDTVGAVSPAVIVVVVALFVIAGIVYAYHLMKQVMGGSFL